MTHSAFGGPGMASEHNAARAFVLAALNMSTQVRTAYCNGNA